MIEEERWRVWREQRAGYSMQYSIVRRLWYTVKEYDSLVSSQVARGHPTWGGSASAPKVSCDVHAYPYRETTHHVRDDTRYESYERRIRATRTSNMSGRLVATRLATLARRTPLLTPRFYTTHSLPAGGLLRNEAGLRLIKRRPWPLGSYALHNLPATRSISFARVIPKLVTKFATAGAAAGGAVIAGVSYIQYQAGRTYTCRWSRSGANSSRGGHFRN
jgi:hypothetical protein